MEPGARCDLLGSLHVRLCIATFLLATQACAWPLHPESHNPRVQGWASYHCVGAILASLHAMVEFVGLLVHKSGASPRASPARNRQVCSQGSKQV